MRFFVRKLTFSQTIALKSQKERIKNQKSRIKNQESAESRIKWICCRVRSSDEMCISFDSVCLNIQNEFMSGQKHRNYIQQKTEILLSNKYFSSKAAMWFCWCSTTRKCNAILARTVLRCWHTHDRYILHSIWHIVRTYNFTRVNCCNVKWRRKKKARITNNNNNALSLVINEGKNEFEHFRLHECRTVVQI